MRHRRARQDQWRLADDARGLLLLGLRVGTFALRHERDGNDRLVGRLLVHRTPRQEKDEQKRRHMQQERHAHAGAVFPGIAPQLFEFR